MTAEVTREQGLVLELTPQGLGRLDRHIELPYCLPGEIVSFDKVSRRKKNDYYFKEILKPVSVRKPAICPHFTKCGGCTLQHLEDQFYKDYKKSIVTTYFNQSGLDPYIVEDPILIPAGHRRRTNMDIRKKNNLVFLGYHQLKSFHVTNIGPCPVLDPKIEVLLEPLGALFDKVLVNFQKAKIFITLTAVGIDLSLEIQEIPTLDENQRTLLKDFAESHNLCRLMFRYRKTIDLLHKKEDPYVIIDSIPVSIDPWSFLQSSEKADEILTKWVIDALPEKPSLISDLFCGRGTFTLPLSKKGAVLGYEWDDKALEALNVANKTVAKRPITLTKKDLFTDPVLTQNLNNSDVVVIDPPRAGAENQCLELAKSKVSKVIYVSCNPETFTRDAVNLIKGGYTLKTVKLLDQFIYTPHLEVFGVFTK